MRYTIKRIHIQPLQLQLNLQLIPLLVPEMALDLALQLWLSDIATCAVSANNSRDTAARESESHVNMQPECREQRSDLIIRDNS